MMRCPLCQAQVPEVVGAASQVCPQCGAEVPVEAVARPVAVRPDNSGALRRAVRTVFQDYGAWVLLYLPLAVLALGVELLGLLATGYEGTAPTEASARAILVATALPFIVLQFGLGAAFLGVGAAVTARAVEEGRKVRPMDGLALLRARAPALLGAGLIYVAVLLAGAIPLVVPMFFFLHRYLWTTALVAEGASPGQAFAESRELARRPGMKATTLVIVLAWLSVVIVRYSVGAMLAPWFGGGEMGATIGGALVAIPLLPFVPALVGSCLVAVRGKPTAASVACPGCSRPIGYVATGSPQTLTCGHCGRTGTVR